MLILPQLIHTCTFGVHAAQEQVVLWRSSVAAAPERPCRASAM